LGLLLQNMGFLYQQRRVDLVHRLLNTAAALGLVDDFAHDAVLLMDRTMSTSLQARPLAPPPLAKRHLRSLICSIFIEQRVSDETAMPCRESLCAVSWPWAMFTLRKNELWNGSECGSNPKRSCLCAGTGEG
jgi:hypothetical protein